MATFVCGNVSWGRQKKKKRKENFDTYQYTYMCVYYAFINKTIDAKTAPTTLSSFRSKKKKEKKKAGNLLQSFEYFSDTLLFLFLYFFSSSSIQTLMHTSST